MVDDHMNPNYYLAQINQLEQRNNKLFVKNVKLEKDNEELKKRNDRLQKRINHLENMIMNPEDEKYIKTLSINRLMKDWDEIDEFNNLYKEL